MNITVCLCSYNGEQFIGRQIESILGQLEDRDELIVRDDGSTDRTLEVVASYSDYRVRVFRNETRLGVAGNFDRCIQDSQNSVVFLSDQDDLWLPARRRVVTDCFAAHPEVSLVLTNALMIDADESVLDRHYLPIRTGTAPGLLRAFSNFARNKYLGCALAFRRELIPYLAPIPRSVPMHDMFIGILADIVGKTMYVDQPTIAYRVHGGNTTTPRRHSPPFQMLKWRLALGNEIFKRLLRGPLPR